MKKFIYKTSAEPTAHKENFEPGSKRDLAAILEKYQNYLVADSNIRSKYKPFYRFWAGKYLYFISNVNSKLLPKKIYFSYYSP